MIEFQVFRGRLALSLAPLILCVAVLAGCGTFTELRLNAAKAAKENLDKLFASYKGPLGDAEMRACLDSQLNKPKSSAIIGKPTFTPNYFLSCIANSPNYARLFSTSIGRVLIYKVSAETNDVSKRVEAMQAVGGEGKWIANFNCAYILEGDKLEAFKEEKYGIFYSVQAVPSRIHRNDPCLEMPEAGNYLRGRAGVWR